MGFMVVRWCLLVLFMAYNAQPRAIAIFIIPEPVWIKRLVHLYIMNVSM